MRYNPPPTWPAPPEGWQPPSGWQPPAEWGPAPDGWSLWVEDRPPRPSVWSTLGIALASAFVIGSLLGALLGDGDDLAGDMGYGTGRMLLPALLVGGIWPFAVPRLSRWLVPLVVLLVGGTLTLLLTAAQVGA